MRNLLRNLQPVFYRMYEGEEEIQDQYGNSTGNYLPIYGTLKSAMLCVSPNIGTSETEQFGSLENYDRTMTTSDTSCEIDENAVLWIDNADTDDAWNAVVKQRAPWKNSISFAIQSVEVSNYQSYQEALQQKIQFEKMRSSSEEGKGNAGTQVQP